MQRETTAQTLTWTGNAGTTDFGTAGNWFDDTTGTPAVKPPERLDTVIFTGSGTITGTGKVKVLDISNPATDFVFQSASITAFTVNDGGLMTLSAGATLTSGFVNVSAGGTLDLEQSTLTTDGKLLTLTIAGSDSAQAALVIDHGSDVSIGSGLLVVGDKGETGFDSSLTVAGGTLTGNSKSKLDIGVATYGTATITNSTLSIAHMFVGTQGGDGAMAVTGGTFTTSLLQVGNDGTGAITFTNASARIGENAATPLLIGSSPSPADAGRTNGAVTVDGGSAVTFDGTLTIGKAGTGSLTVIGGSTLTTNGALQIGARKDLGGAGYISISQSEWTQTGSVSLQSGTIALQNSSSGTITGDLSVGIVHGDVTDAVTLINSSLDVTGTVTIGTSPSFMAISPGGTLVAGALVVTGGQYPGTLTVDGNPDNSAVVSTGSLNLGPRTSLELGAYTDWTIGSATVTGTLNADSASAAILLNGPLSLVSRSDFEISNGATFTIDSSGQGLQMTDAVASLSGSTSLLSVNGAMSLTETASITATGATISDTGGLSLTNGSSLTITGGALSVSAASGIAFSTDASSLVQTSGNVTVNGDSDIAGQFILTDSTYSDSGTLTVESSSTFTATGTISGIVNDLGQIIGTNGVLTFLGALGGSGYLSVGPGCTLTVNNAVESGIQVELGATGTLVVGDVGAFDPQSINSWGPADTIVFDNIDATSDQVVNNALLLYGASGNLLVTVQFGIPVTQNEFTLGYHDGNTYVTYN